MNKRLIALVLATSFALSACANDGAKDKKDNGSNETQTSESAKGEKLPDDAVALVGGEKITKDSYKDEMFLFCNACKQTTIKTFNCSNASSR